MKRRDLLRSGGAALLAASSFPLHWSKAAEKKPQKVLYFTRNVGFYHSVVQRTGDQLSHSEKILVQLGKQNGFEVHCSKDGRVFDGDLDQYDAFVFYTNGDLTLENPQHEPPMTQAGKQRLLAAVAAGKGFVALHSSCACWRTPGPKIANSEQIDPYLAMVGGEFIAHGPQQKATMRITSPQFPGLSGLDESFELHEEWYALKNFAPDLHVILVQETAGMKGDCYQRPPFPSTWARRQGQGRVFFTAMAHREDVWEGQPFQQIVLGGLAWAMGNVEAEIPKNIDQVAPQAGQLTAS